MALLEVRDLTTRIATRAGIVHAVNGVSLTVEEGETLGLVGESGSGKSMICWSVVRLLPRASEVAGSVRFEGEELTTKSNGEMTHIRGRRIAMILQDPMSSLNPVFSVGMQVGEAVTLHKGLRGRRRDSCSEELLAEVGINSPATRLEQYPHQMSGGMRQRVVGAMAIVAPPKLLIADEPTTNLDPTVQVQYLELLRRIQREKAMAMILVSHDLRVVSRLCGRTAVVYAGRIVESGPTHQIWKSPRHPYTQGLLGSVPKLGVPRSRLSAINGQPPERTIVAKGCAFAPRCPMRMERCTQESPPEVRTEPDHMARCWVIASNNG